MKKAVHETQLQLTHSPHSPSSATISWKYNPTVSSLLPNIALEPETREQQSEVRRNRIDFWQGFVFVVILRVSTTQSTQSSKSI